MRTARSEPLGTVTTGDHESAHRDRRVEQSPLAGLVEGPFQHDGELAAGGEELGPLVRRVREVRQPVPREHGQTQQPRGVHPLAVILRARFLPVLDSYGAGAPPMPADGDLAGPRGDNRHYP